MKKKRNWFLPGIYALVAVMNVLSWYGEGFGDRVRLSIFQVTQMIQGRISSLFPFSVGELLLILAALLSAGALILAAIVFIRWLAGSLRWSACGADKRELPADSKKGKNLKAFAGRYYHVLLWLGGIVSVVMSINCFLLYHCTSFQENYMPGERREYKVGELAILRDYVVEQCNELAELMERDENGYIVYREDMGLRAVEEMKRLGDEYPLLDGYYPAPKRLTFSGFFSQQYMMGYYFPFTMEANYNGKMYIANVPSTMCHELSHVKGFIYEDDANFIGYLACITSEDAFFRYSGYLSVLDYLNRDLYESLGYSMETYATYETLSPLVERDKIFLTKEAWEEVESRAVLDTETVKKASRGFLETNLQINGIEEGVASYGDVVEQLLIYYDGALY